MFPSAFEALDRRLDGHSSCPIALAFSGGGDSVALLHTAKAWSEAAGRRLIALTVDHGLHRDSAGWTAQAGRMARSPGVAWRSLPWLGEKPVAGLPAAARAARHRLLAQAALEAGACVLLLGHTADDQLESTLMRADTPALGRLREWSPSPVWPEGRGLFLLRPLLHERRAALRDVLSAQGAEWLDDPANRDPRFARTRARAALAVQASSGAAAAAPHPELVGGRGIALSPAGLTLRQARGEADCGNEGVRESLVALGQACTQTLDGRLIIPRRLFTEALGAAPQFLSIALLCASGAERPPRGGVLDRLTARVAGEGGVTAAASGARITAAAETVEFHREAGERARGGLRPVAVEPGETAVFDGRFAVEAGAEPLTVAPAAGLMARLSGVDLARLRRLPAAARPSFPLLLGPRGAVTLPAPFGRAAGRVEALAGLRLAAACGLIRTERELEQAGMAQAFRSPYLEA